MTGQPSTAGGDELDAVRQRVEELGAALAVWAERDPSAVQPAVRRAGNTALAAVDAAAAELRRLRYRLAAEIREGDQAGAARADAYRTALEHGQGGTR